MTRLRFLRVSLQAASRMESAGVYILKCNHENTKSNVDFFVIS
jgi:hypothetical protein